MAPGQAGEAALKGQAGIGSPSRLQVGIGADEAENHPWKTPCPPLHAPLGLLSLPPCPEAVRVADGELFPLLCLQSLGGKEGSLIRGGRRWQ